MITKGKGKDLWKGRLIPSVKHVVGTMLLHATLRYDALGVVN